MRSCGLPDAPERACLHGKRPRGAEGGARPPGKNNGRGEPVGNVIEIAAARARRSRQHAGDLVGRIDALRADAERRGLTTLAYFLDIAVTEAMVQARRGGEAGAGSPLDATPGRPATND